MIHKELTFDIILRLSNEKEKSLERNFTFQCLLLLTSFVYIIVGPEKITQSKAYGSEIFNPIFENRQVLHIVMPALLTYYFIRMGHNLYSYLFHRKLLYDYLDINLEKAESEYKFSDIYSSYTNSSFFEAINLFVLTTNKKSSRLKKNNKLFLIYLFVFMCFLGLNHAFTLFYLTDFLTKAAIVNILFAVIFFTMIVLGYKVFLDTYPNQFYPRVKVVFMLYAAFSVTISLIILKNICFVI